MSVRLVVDTDIGSDVDDALALALAVRHPDLELRAVTTVSSQPDVRAQLARQLLDVAGAADVEVAVGTSVAGDDRNVVGPEHVDLLSPPSDGGHFADAVELLAGLTRDTALATIGQQTNVAAALARDGALARRAAGLTVMGGAFPPIDGTGGEAHGAERDWNFVLDPRAAVVSLSSGWRTLRYVPIDVTFGVPLSRAHVERLRGGDDLCVLLVDLIDGWRARAFPDDGPIDVACYLHDPLTVACVTECEFIEAARLSVSVVIDGYGVAHTVIDPTEGHPATVVREVDAPAFADWLIRVLLGDFG